MADSRSILQFPDVSDESARDRLCRLVRFCDGWSLSHNRDNLAALVGRGVDPPSSTSVEWRTNCATSALGIVAFACGTVEAANAVHALLAKPSENGKALTWLSQIGDAKGAWVAYSTKGAQPAAGDLMWYWNHPTKVNDKGETVVVYDDHVEWCLCDTAQDFTADHGGGGRSDNAITVGSGDIRFNAGRALRKFLNLDKLGIVPVATENTASDGDSGDTNSGTADPSAEANDIGTSEQYAIAGANDFTGDTVADSSIDDNDKAS
jgi:hypothetical protein